MLLLVLLQVLYVLRPPVQPPISAGIIANMGIRLNTAKLLAVGSGKLTGWQEVHTLPAGDSLSGQRFLVDTGASVSVFPQISPTSSAPLSKTKLLTTGGSPLPCFGARVIPLRFGSRHFSWSFQLTPVSIPILGSDFLRHHALLVDIARARVLDADYLDVLFPVSSIAASDLFWAHLQQAPREIPKLLSKYPEVLFLDGFLASTPKHGVFHNLPTDPGPPVFAKARRLGSEKLASTKAEFFQDGESRDCLTFLFFMVQSSPHGT